MDENQEEEGPITQFFRVRMVSLKWMIGYYVLNEDGNLINQPHMTDGPYSTEKEAKLHILEGWSDADKSDLAVGAI